MIELFYRLTPVDFGAADQFRPPVPGVARTNHLPAIIGHSPADGGERSRDVNGGTFR